MLNSNQRQKLYFKWEHRHWSFITWTRPAPLGAADWSYWNLLLGQVWSSLRESIIHTLCCCYSWTPQKSKAFRALPSFITLKWVEGKKNLTNDFKLMQHRCFCSLLSFLSTLFLLSPTLFFTLFDLVTHQSYKFCIFLSFRLHLLKHIFSLFLQYLSHFCKFWKALYFKDLVNPWLKQTPFNFKFQNTIF